MKLSRMLSTLRDDDCVSDEIASPASASLSPLSPHFDDARGAALVSFQVEAREHLAPAMHLAKKAQSAAMLGVKKKSRRTRLTTLSSSAAAAPPVGTSKAKASAATRLKRKRKLSPKQMERWLEKEADDSQIYNLALDVNDLKQQLQHYTLRKNVYDTRMLVARINFDGATLRTVDHFFKIFYDGSRNIKPDEQSFLLASTDEALSLGTAAYGRHHLFEQWERYTRIFHMHAFVNASTVVMSSDPECTIVRCDGKFDGRISRETIEIVFPHILDDEELVQRVIGRRIRVPVQTLLYFDAAGRIVRYDAHVGVFQGMNELLASNPKDVITMMANAQINDASMIPGEAGTAPDEVARDCPSPKSPSSRFFPVEEEEEDRLSLDYILS